MTGSKRYVRIDEGEFDEFIGDAVADHRVVDEPGTREKVYELPLPADGLSIRVYSTIQGGRNRGRGEDAIRCVVWSDEAGCPVGGRRKTLRIGTWRDNLREKIEDLYSCWRDHVHGACPRCSRGVLVERTPSGGQDWDPFLSCSEWEGPDRGCQYTEPMP